MPLYPFVCESGHRTEDLFKVDACPNNVACEVCGLLATRTVSKIRFTPGRWGDSHGGWNKGLNCYVENDMHRDRIMAQRGLVHESELPSGAVESHVTDVVNDHEEHNRTASRYERNLKDAGGDVSMAIAETFPAEECLA